MSDIVAELDEWLEREATTQKHYPADDVDTVLLQRARDEIVALRAQLKAVEPLRIAMVAELRNWVTDWNGAAMVRGEPPRDGIHCDVLYDAIDEIVALRRIASALTRPERFALARAEALEEAARLCEGGYTTGSMRSTLKAIAAAIRALKEKPA